MYEVTQDYLDKATAAGRVYSLRVDVGEVVDGAFVDKAQYLGGVGVLSLKIVRGQTTGGFSLGGTVCAQLSATFTNDVDVRVKDRLQVYVRFGSGDNATAWRGLGWFYVDSVKQGLYSKSVTAYDAMLRLEKNYKSKLTYPAKTSDVLNEISDQTNINLSSSLSLVNDATIETAPQMDKSEDGEQRYYTRRTILGYIAATNAGEAYIDVDFKINLAMPTETGYTIEAASAISQTIDDTDFMIGGIVWNKSGISYSLNDDFTENTVELINPLEYTSEEQILHNLETKLVGLSYSSITLKKQGTGIFQLGDLVNYVALDGTAYTMLVMGIVYDFSNGFFSETLYSLAKSTSQQEYAGSQVTNQKEYTSSAPTGGDTFNDAIIITQGDIPYILHSYTVVEYLRDWIIAAKGPDTQIIVNGYIVHDEYSLDMNTATIYSIVRFNATTTDTGELSTKILKVALYRGGRTSDGRSYINFLVLDENGSKIRGPFQSFGTFGLVLTFNFVNAPDELHPFGYAFIKAWAVVTDKNGTLTRITNSLATLYASFVSTDEYKAAIRLVKSPDVGNEIIETTVKDDGSSTLEKAMMYTDTVAKSLQDSFSNITDADREQIEQNASDIAAHNVRITAAEAEIDEINAPTTGILPQAKSYTDFVADELRGEFGTT